MVLKFQGTDNTWVLKESNSISYSRFVIEPKEMERINLKIDSTQLLSKKEGAVVGTISYDDPFISFQDLIEEKIIAKKLDAFFGIWSDNVHHCYGEMPNIKDDEVFFGVAVMLDNNEIYVLDGAKKAFIINDNGKTIDKL